ncbi:5'-nucleotidase, lipoprotein e(P4) family [Rhodohalobacter mucosus]|nr:5'-nucleotidase, lipoprotein e(P4) family [Rhodohalobacter mucosus]
MKYKLVPVLLLLIAGVSCKGPQMTSQESQPQPHPALNETLFATLWTQTAAEYDALTLQAYQTAERFLELALADSGWTASMEQDTGYEALPPAIILDVDETVLDNSYYQARIILDQQSYNPDTWNEWVREARATPIAGALELTKTADELGIAVFYITNRDAEVEQATIQNLEELGFPIADGSVLTNGARPGWTSAKTNRRAHVSENHRILMLFGDDLNDFLPARSASMEQRDRLVEENREKWGVQWFILPNPVYGSWERSLYYGTDGLSEDERMNLWLEKLETRE